VEDELCQKMRDVNWLWGDKDPNALAILEERVAETGRNLGMITYSDLVKGIRVSFTQCEKWRSLPNFNL
jgi:hypothetical protein